MKRQRTPSGSLLSRPPIREGAKHCEQLPIFGRQDALAVVGLEVAEETARSDCAEFESPVLGAVAREELADEWNPQDFRRRWRVNHDVVAGRLGQLRLHRAFALINMDWRTYNVARTTRKCYEPLEAARGAMLERATGSSLPAGAVAPGYANTNETVRFFRARAARRGSTSADTARRDTCSPGAQAYSLARQRRASGVLFP
jgi:hypothetical protein